MGEVQRQPSAQLGRGIWQQFTIADGLPDMKIECIHEDSRGDLWIGTHDRGVVRFDGISFEGFSRRDGLAGHGVYSVIEDRDGVLWFGTSGGLTRYDGKTLETVDCGGDYSFLWGSCMDEEGVLWFGVGRCPGAPPLLLRHGADSAEIVQLHGRGLATGQSINRVVTLQRGRLLCGGQGLYIGDGESFDELLSPDVDVNELYVAKNGDTWIGSDSGLRLLECGGELRNLSSETSIESIHADIDGRILMATYGGSVMQWNGDHCERVHQLEAVLWRGACSDSRGRLWLASYGMGLYCCDATRIRVITDDEGLPSRKVKTLARCSDGSVWIGTATGLASLVNGDLRVHPAGRREVEITALLASSVGEVWIGTRRGALLVARDGLVSRIGPTTGIDRYGLSHLAEDGDGRIWFASRHGQGVGHSDRDGHVTLFPPDGVHGLPRWVGALACDGQGRVWLGSAEPSDWAGVCALAEDGSLEEGLPVECAVLALTHLGDGRLLLGSNEGVIDVAVADRTMAPLPLDLGCSVITAIRTTADGVIWIGTEGGGTYTHDGVALQHIEIPGAPACNVVNDILDGGQGVMWLATEGGLLRYERSTHEPQAHITDVLADGKLLPQGSVEVPADVKRLRLAYRGHSESETTASLVYLHRLCGYDNSWSQTSAQSVEYVGLEAGEYRFELRAVDRDLNYSDTAQLEVTVTSDPRTVAINEALREGTSAGSLLGSSSSLKTVRDSIQRLAEVDILVLVTGETGTGKGLVARALHEASARRGGPLVHVNCGFMQEALVDSELFGHERGAFTGAVSRRLGKFELARGGTIFLDEIGDLPPGAQARLLNVLQEYVIERVGGGTPIEIDVRVVAATNRDLQAEVARERFRRDLYYRIAGFPIRMPALRERVEDIPELVEHFGRQFALHLSREMPVVSEEAMSLLTGYAWPGNVRELEHVVRRAVLLAARGCVMPEHLGLPSSLTQESAVSTEPIVPLREHERRYFERVLEHTDGVIYGKSGAAALLDIPPSTLRSRLAKLGLGPSRRSP